MAHPKPAFVETLIEANNVRSLVWSGDSLVDWASGGVTYQLDGSSAQASVCYSYPFDAATTAPGSEYAVIYQQGNVTLVASDGRSAAPTADVFPRLHRRLRPEGTRERRRANARLTNLDPISSCP